MNKENNLKSWLYLLPAILFLGFFMVYPLVDVFVYSFEEGYNSASQTFFGVGLYNYSYVLHDPYFLQALKNTFILVIITVPLSTIIALLISVGLNSITPLKKLYQTVYFLPYVTNTLAVGLVFMILFKKTAYTDGLANLILAWFGKGPIDFIDGPYWAKMFVLCFYTIWVVMPFKVLILTSALASVNQDYYNPEDHPADDQPDDLLSGDHRLHRGLQGLQRRGGSVRHEPERRGDEHHRGLCLRHALRRFRRLSVLCLGGGHHTVRRGVYHHADQPVDFQEERALLTVVGVLRNSCRAAALPCPPTRKPPPAICQPPIRS